MKKDRVIFLDRDGTINEEANYLFRTEELRLYPGVPQALAKLKKAGFKLCVVTNQAGVARGYYTEEDVLRLHEYLNEILAGDGAQIDHFFYCPHHPQKGIGKYLTRCSCRKPDDGLLRMAGQYYDVDRENSFLVGDKATDIMAGQKYGVRTVLVGTGYGKTEKEKCAWDIYAEDLAQAAEKILKLYET